MTQVEAGCTEMYWELWKDIYGTESGIEWDTADERRKKAEMIEVSVKQHSERKCCVTKEENKNIVKVRIN